jgi:hypothetical protein
MNMAEKSRKLQKELNEIDDSPEGANTIEYNLKNIEYLKALAEEYGDENNYYANRIKECGENIKNIENKPQENSTFAMNVKGEGDFVIVETDQDSDVDNILLIAITEVMDLKSYNDHVDGKVFYYLAYESLIKIKQNITDHQPPFDNENEKETAIKLANMLGKFIETDPYKANGITDEEMQEVALNSCLNVIEQFMIKYAKKQDYAMVAKFAEAYAKLKEAINSIKH